MSRRRGPDDRKRLDPEDVLAGRVKVGAGELLDLIHRVNPTGRELGARDAELRYAQKARLQSLLVRRFGAELSVAPDPAGDGTVSIFHRGHGRDGCHAVIDTLDEDARAWVRLQIDLGPPSSEAPSPPVPAARPSGRGLPPADEDEGPSSSDASPDSLVRLADEAAAAYDFERARACLERAVAASDGAAAPAAALLVLLVETLGDDASALALQPSLSRAALADPDVRALLALAAARSGDPDQAIVLVRGASERRAAEVSAALASRAVSAGDAAQAAAHLADLRRRDPAHPALAGLTGEVARFQAAARGPFEAELSALVAAGQEAEAEKKAAEVLARWPESEAARRVLRAAEERRRLAQEAAAHRAREMEAAAQAKREAERAALVRAQLAAPDPREGLLAWLDLDPALRRRVGELGEAAELCRWIDLTPARAAPAARVEAVLAIPVARQILSGDPQGVIDALAPHEATLERVPEARRIAREAHAEIAARRAAQARAEVAAARRDLAGGDAASALARLDAPLLRDLGDAERAEAEALRAEAARIVAKEKRVADVGRLRLRGQLFEARSLADELRAEAPPEERPRWEEERRAIQEEIQRAFRVEIDREPFPLGEEQSPEATQTMMEAPVWLTEDGRTLVLVEGRQRWVWIQLVDVGSRTVRAEMVLRTPEPVGKVVFHVLGSTAWLTSGRGALLAIDVERFTVEQFRPAREILPPGRHVGGVAIAADRGATAPRYYWVMPADEEGFACPVQVIDLETRRVVREVADVIRLAGIPGMREARVGCFKPSGLALYEDRGVPAPGGRFPRQDVSLVLAAAHPSGEGLVAEGSIASSPWHRVRIPQPGSRRSPEPRGTGPSALVLVDLSAGPARTPWIIDALGGGTVMGLASSRETGLCAVTLVNADLRWELLVVRPAGGTFELLHRSEVPSYTAAVRDAGARHVLLYSDSPRILAPLGPTPPDVPRSEKPPGPWISDVTGAPACLGSAGARAEAYRELGESLKDQPPALIAATSRVLQREGDPEPLVERARALAAADEPDAQRLREWLWEHHRENARVRLLRADELARLDRWDEVREILAPCTSASFAGDEDHAQHLSHMLALAALHLGDVEEARRRTAEAGEHQGSCKLRGLIAVLAPRPHPLAAVREGADEAADPPLLTQIVWAVHAADACLDAGDAEGALAALDPRRFAVVTEVQVLARRAEAWLRLSPPPGRRRFAKIVGLARLIEAHEGGPDEKRDELPLPGATWDESRLDDIVKRAAAWLEAYGADDGDQLGIAAAGGSSAGAGP
jgi:hypothetical protein